MRNGETLQRVMRAGVELEALLGRLPLALKRDERARSLEAERRRTMADTFK